MKIAVIGCGNVGFAHLVWMKKRGFDVLGYDVDLGVQKRIAETIGEACVAYDLKSLASCEFMEAELDASLGYEKNQKGDLVTTNKRNGHSPKTLKSQYGNLRNSRQFL